MKEGSEMAIENFKYIIVGGGLAGASAVEGIRDLDSQGSILLIGSEKVLPYNRPPLTKQLWTGKKKLEEIFVYHDKYFEDKGVTLVLGHEAMGADGRQKTITDNQGRTYAFEKLLLATGGIPRTLNVPGGDSPEIYYYRYLDDYLRLRPEAGERKSAVVIGGGFIGSEIAAALRMNKLDVTMVFPSSYLCSRVFPSSLGMAMTQFYRDRGIRVLAGDKPVSFTRQEDRFLTETGKSEKLNSDILIIGIGIVPEIRLAVNAGLKTGNGIIVDEYLQTSNPDIYAAGDNAFFPYQALAQSTRIEHWDNALNQGKWAGRNMAGAHEPFLYMPYFFSDLFEFGYEAVGEIDSRLDTLVDWQEENKKGIIYYLQDNKVRGVMACNLWDKMESARNLIRRGKRTKKESLHAAIA